ncbi:MAG TPA: cell envelope integrity protein TolA [Thiobacillaceae bacterium]|nr:cell envelope integrity protein TolA [Thiobacillaceae bacterium]HNI08324.1 cell envelope integrity protein TolA [Thiobacillaceae bacterium]
MTRNGRLQHFSSGGLALLVHGLFFAALVWGVSWKNPPSLPVQADLWSALPEPPPPPPVLEPAPLPAPPPPPPVVEKRPDDAEIALQKAEKKKQELARREEEKRKEVERQAELKKQAELKRQAEEQARLEKARQEQERLEREKKEQARRQMEQDLARQMQSELDAESAQLRAIQERAKAGRQARVINDFKHRIQAKIQAYVRLPQKMVGNPEAVFLVTLFPNGEVNRVTLVKSSGQPVYDSEVERAILKASPLPLPGDKEAASVFRDGLTLKFRPQDEAGGGT